MRRPLIITLLIAALAVATGVAWTGGHLNATICGGDCGPEHATLPDGVRSVAPAALELDQGVAAGPDVDAVLAALRDRAGAAVLGDHVGVAVGSVQRGSEVATLGTGTFVPASTTKLLTGFAALLNLDPKQRFATRVVAERDRLVLVGGGDPYLTDRRSKDDPRVVRADLATLAARTARALKRAGTSSVTLGYDDSLFSGPAVSVGWPSTYVRDNVVTPIAALWVDRGMVDTSQPESTPRVADPAKDAADRFAAALRAEGVEIEGPIDRTEAPVEATALAEVQSATVSQIVEATVRTSDDEAAEVLLRQLAVAAGRSGSFADGVDVVADSLRAAGIDVDGLHLEDGSGLSRENRISPTTLVEVIRAALANGRTAAVVDDLPVSGFSGTLAARFAREAQGLVRAKTGTLTGVHSLAGIALDPKGRPVVFAVMADRTDRSQPFAAQAAVDQVAAAISAD